MPRTLLLILTALLAATPAHSLERPGVEYKIYQFPSDMIPRIDGDTSDWDMVPESYVIDGSHLRDVREGHEGAPQPGDKEVRVTVGWVAGMNRLYVLYDSYDDFWDFERDTLQNDIFELVIDGDLSGGPLIKQMNPNNDIVPEADLHFTYHGVHAQNHHIFTPPGKKDWNMVWGCPQWIKELPYANYAYTTDFTEHGQSGHLILECWITPFDFAPYAGPEMAVESTLEENKLIGMSWSILEYDDNDDRYRSFFNLSHKTQMYGDASLLVAFRLMPLEERFVPELKADWTFTVLNLDRREVAFHDRSIGEVTGWTWSFGEETMEKDPPTKTISHEQHPIHRFETPGEKMVTLTVEGPAGTDRLTRVWDVVVR